MGQSKGVSDRTNTVQTKISMKIVILSALIMAVFAAATPMLDFEEPDLGQPECYNVTIFDLPASLCCELGIDSIPSEVFTQNGDVPYKGEGDEVCYKVEVYGVECDACVE